jgi:hypothetical protein
MLKNAFAVRDLETCSQGSPSDDLPLTQTSAQTEINLAKIRISINSVQLFYTELEMMANRTIQIAAIAGIQQARID